MHLQPCAVVWICFAAAGGYKPSYGLLILSIMFTISLALCLPFFSFLFFFVNPKKVIEKIMIEGIHESTQTKLKPEHVESAQNLATASIEHLAHFALHALSHHDVSISLYATDAMCSQTIVYGTHKNA